MDLKIGTKVRYTHVLVRHSLIESSGYQPDMVKWWEPQPEQGSGYIVGLRQAYSGRCVNHGPDDGIEWRASSGLWCYLVAKDIKSKHVRVPVDAVEVVDG